MRLTTRLRNRIAQERGFTLIELLVVLIIISILVTIAVPSYLGFKQRAEARSAAANVRSAIPAAEAYYSDNEDYDGMTLAALQSFDQGISASLVVAETDSEYTLTFTTGACTATFAGPGGGSPTVVCT